MKPLETHEGRVASRPIFEEIYAQYNKRCYVSPDPLQFMYEYESPRDCETVGLIASSLAYGRVAQILKSIEKILKVLGNAPSEYLINTPRRVYEEALSGFVHRFTDSKSMCDFLEATGEALRTHGTLENLFMQGYDGQLIGGMESFADTFCRIMQCENTYLLPRPSKGSACKRFVLFLRWCVRRDDVDLGLWHGISPRDLVVPLDTHMFNIACTLGLCSGKSANGNAVHEITENYKDICPEDPVKYDFALTRYGIRSDMNIEDLLKNSKFAL